MADDGLRQTADTLTERPGDFLHLIGSTPAFVLDLDGIAMRLAELQVLRRCGFDLLYSIKALPLRQLLQFMLPYVDGFSVSSLYEARLAYQTGGGGRKLCMTSPGLRMEQLSEMAALCTHISFNSQRMFKAAVNAVGATHRSQFGVRINPGLSFLDDDRYNPCRIGSKLGVALADMADWPGDGDISPAGWHFHTVFDRVDAGSLQATLEHMHRILGPRPVGVNWINLGGGYRLQDAASLEIFSGIAADLQRQGYQEIMIEPGKGLVGNAGYMVSSVTDMFVSDGRQIAVLDTSINHNPEVFEYQRPPRLTERTNGDYPVMLVGGTCLAGDIFGEYHLSRRLRIGDRITMCGVGAYTLVKANLFNGHALPDIHLWQDQQLLLARQHGFADYAHLWNQAVPEST